MNQPETNAASPSSLKIVLRSTFVLIFYAVIGTAIVAFTFNLTKGVIENNQNNVLSSQINELIPEVMYNNTIHTDRLVLQAANAPEIGASGPTTFYRARMNQLPVALAVTTDAPDGYGGAISLLIAIRAQDMSLLGVRVISHAETPGLGDKIDLAKGPWILDFNGKSIGNPAEEMWRVKKDGGLFDQFSGATVTPRAVVNAVRRTLIYAENNQQTLFRQKSDPVRE